MHIEKYKKPEKFKKKNSKTMKTSIRSAHSMVLLSRTEQHVDAENSENQEPDESSIQQPLPGQDNEESDSDPVSTQEEKNIFLGQMDCIPRQISSRLFSIREPVFEQRTTQLNDDLDQSSETPRSSDLPLLDQIDSSSDPHIWTIQGKK